VWIKGIFGRTCSQQQHAGRKRVTSFRSCDPRVCYNWHTDVWMFDNSVTTQ
jgi:hypothetical protein